MPGPIRNFKTGRFATKAEAADPNFIRMNLKVKAEMEKVERAVAKLAFKNFRHAAASISKDAKASIEKAAEGEASAPGEPPHTHRGSFFKRAIRYDVNQDGAVIGPTASVIGEELGPTHEFGQERGGVDFPERATMGPALERAIPRFGGSWRGALAE